jgi:hypothetical protein
MKLPEGFQYSQSSLQDFVDCRRLFFLRHVCRISWPALDIVDGSEHAAQIGAQFHRLAHQYLIGMPLERLEQGLDDPQLERLWACFQDFLPQIYNGCQPEECRLSPEAAFSAPLGNRRIAARCDLLCISSHSILIYDWKTTRRRPERDVLEERLQTSVYPYVLVRAGRHINGRMPVRPEQVELIYWYPGPVDQVERFPYSQERFRADEDILRGIIAAVEQLDVEGFTQTGDESRCLSCTYRTLCENGASPSGSSM